MAENMAANVAEQTPERTEDAVIYIMPQRIQKKMLLDIKSAVARHRFAIREKYGEDVTHVVTQYNEYEQVLRQLERDGASVSDSSSLSANIVTLAWLSACLKAGSILPVEDKHRLKPQSASKDGETAAEKKEPEKQPTVPAWACQRVTPLKHYNKKFTDALETLETYADFRGGDSDYSRALAFRRASCVLKSLPFCVQRISQVEGLRDVGGHALRVIQNILEEGYCDEVESVRNEWFSSMQLFTSVFGIGPATAKKWIERGWKTIDDVRKSDDIPRDDRVVWGLAFHEDLNDPVTRTEADAFTHLVKQEAEAILPGVIVQLTGGFRRGKPAGHDVDILMTHPEEGRERGFLPALLHALEKKGLVLMGRLEASTYHPDVLVSDFKLTSRGMLDHFEKWLGICKFDESFRRKVGSSFVADTAGESKDGRGKVESGDCSRGEESLKQGEVLKSEKTEEAIKNQQRKETQRENKSAAATAVAEDTSEERLGEGSSDQTSNQNKLANTTSSTKNKTNPADPDHVPAMKKRKTANGQTPSEIAASDRSWKARRVDLIVCPWSQYFYALVGWTGNRHFNRDLRLYAQKECNMKLTSHGLFDFTKNASVSADSEAAVFHNLKLEYREPWERNC